MIVKKIIIGLTVFGTFVLYSLGIRDKSPALNKPAALSTTKASSQTTGQVSSGGSTSATDTTTVASYKDGVYTGSIADAYYGNVQVSATISGGKITGVTFLDHPHSHDTSVIINQQAMPYLQQEAIQAQSANVQIVSGATYTSQAFIESLSSALAQAKA